MRIPLRENHWIRSPDDWAERKESRVLARS
jgi:hypothetical protein